jgi:branched-chain amino acid transport system substrate-binding protein
MEKAMTSSQTSILTTGFAALSGFALMALIDVPAAYAQIKIGVFGPMSGDAAAYGTSERNNVELAVKEKNAAGGLLGQKVEAVYGDDGGKPEQAVSVAKRLTGDDGVVILLGSISSPASLAVTQVAAETETPQIVIGGTAHKITEQGNPWVFRSVVPDTKLAADLVDFIHERYPDKQKIGFIYVNDDFGKGGFDSFKARASKYDMNVVTAEKYTRGDLDFTSQLSNIESSGAEILVDWSRYAEGALIAKQFKNKGMTIPRFGCDGQALPKFRELAGDAANGMYYATHFSVATAQGIPAAQVFIEKFRAAYNKDPDFVGAEAYDAATATFAAIAAAGKADHTAIRDALRKVSFDGVRGKFEFDAKGDPLFATHIVLVKDGREINGRAN